MSGCASATTALASLASATTPSRRSRTWCSSSCRRSETLSARATGLPAPVAGEITEVNQQLEEAPELLNESPYELGWIVAFRPAAEPQDLLDAAAYRQAIE